MSIRKAIRQIQALVPERAYAIVFEHKLDARELGELKTICESAHIRALLLTDARVVPLEQVFALVGKTDEMQITEALTAKSIPPKPEPSPDLISNLDVAEAQP